jgi:hypothetical protein
MSMIRKMLNAARRALRLADAATPHPKNVPGDFYVVHGCCTACGVPTALAPDMFDFDADNHCYVKRQPATDSERDAALRVVHAQELGCVRYRGTDTALLRRLGDAGEADQCDVALPEAVRPLVRNHVTFLAKWEDVRAWTESAVLQDFVQYFLFHPNGERFAVTGVVTSRDGADVSISWFEDRFHTVSIRALHDEDRRWLIRHSFGIGLSDFIDDWLRQSEHFDGVRWYTLEQWNGTKTWQERPW